MTAEDARFSIDRSRHFKGGWGFLLESVKSVSAPNSSTVVIKLKTPHAPLLADLAMYAYAIVPEKQLNAAGVTKFFNKPVSSGPFMVTSLQKDSKVVLQANPYWYGKKPNIKSVEVQVVPNDNSRVLLLQKKQVDVIENPPGNLIDQINKYPDLQSELFPSTRVDFIQLDEHFAPFKDRNVRLALNYAIDRDAIVKLAYSGHAIKGSSYMPYKMQYWNSSLKPYPYNLAKAKAILAKSKYPNGFKCFLIEVANDVAGNASAIVIKSNLAKLGISVDIRTYELLTAYDKEDGGNSQMGQRYWTNDIIDPDEVTTFAVDPKGGANAFSTYWSNARGDEARPPGTRGAQLRQARLDVQADPEDRVPGEPVPRARLQPLPLRTGEMGARLPRQPARQLQPLAAVVDGRQPLGERLGRPAFSRRPLRLHA